MINTCTHGLSFCFKLVFTAFLLLMVPCKCLEKNCEYSYLDLIYDIQVMKSENLCQTYKRKHGSMETWALSEDQQLYQTFPIDPVSQNYVREVKNVLFSIVYPTPFRTPVKLVSFSTDVLGEILDFSPEITNSKMFLDFVSGGYTIPESVPLSHRYGGHQFGSWADQLGDGRAVMLGEYVNNKGERWELQLKGSGLTPYSRRGDGRAVLRSSVREFLCSEAMYHLGIPTSRAATLVVSNDPVMRDQFYDGHPTTERGAIVLRLAKSWFRIGSMEILAYKNEISLLKKLVDFVIAQYFPEIDEGDANKYLEFYSRIVSDTADLIAKWQSVGCTHGVGNTDNFSLLSITIDYGPFGFMDEYVPDFVPNTSDDEGRYSYEKQPDVGIYNLDKLRIAMLPLIAETQKHLLNKILAGYSDIYKQKFMDIFRRKLGIENHETDDEMLVAVLLKMMEDMKSDFTMTFRQLAEIDLTAGETDISEELWSLKQLSSHKWFDQWIQIYRKRHLQDGMSQAARVKIMRAANPRYILRNWMAQQAIEKAERNDFTYVNKILRILQNPYREQEEAEEDGYSSRPPGWAKKIRVSCSS